jgi:hypothetical protein
MMLLFNRFSYVNIYIGPMFSSFYRSLDLNAIDLDDESPTSMDLRCVLNDSELQEEAQRRLQEQKDEVSKHFELQVNFVMIRYFVMFFFSSFFLRDFKWNARFCKDLFIYSRFSFICK